MTKLQTSLSQAERRFKSARRNQNWIEAQKCAADMAAICSQMRVEQATEQRLDNATPLDGYAWLQRTRRVIGMA